MRRLFWLALFPASLAAQRPAVSPVLPRVWNGPRDTTLSVWLFVRPDVPLADVAVRLRQAGARVRVQSRWLHAISVDASTAVLRSLAQDPALRRIQPLGRFKLRPPRGAGPMPIEAATAAACDSAGDPVYGPGEMPYRQLGLRPLTDNGVDGSGVRIAILDAGFNTLNPAFSAVSVVAQRDFVFNDSIVRDQPNDQPGAQGHGTSTWSLFAANVPGQLLGVARGATYLLAKTEDIRTETRVEEDNYVAALEWADSIGVDIVSSSLGYLAFDNGFSYTPSQRNGDFAVTTIAADSAARRGILVVTAAGNDGPGFRTLSTPADGDSVLAVGAEDSVGAIAGFSSRGPTGDGRLKPDFTAPGVSVCVVTGVGSLGRLNGTSFATPLLAASAALVKQLHPTMAPMELRAAFRANANNRTAPDSTRGWGRPNVAAAAVFPQGLTPVSPTPGGPALTTATPTFSWSSGAIPAYATPVSYRIRIARDSLFASPIVDSTLIDVTTHDLARALKPGPFYWRVYATAANGATASTGRVGPVTAPAWATLTSLNAPGGTATDSVQPTFTWTSPTAAAPPGPFTYDLFVQQVGEQIPQFSAGGLTATSFRLPQPLERNSAYRWYLVVHLDTDTSLVASAGSFLVLDGSLPVATLLYQNFPNPFPTAGRDSTCLWFDLPRTGLVELTILDLRGNAVRHFVPGPDFPAVLAAGRYGRGTAGGGTCDPRLTWDGHADDGRRLPAGVYLYKLKALGTVLFKRIVYRGGTP